MPRTTAKKTSARRARKRTTTTARRAQRTTSAAATKQATAAPARSGVADLAGGLRVLLDSIESEVRAVTALSDRIDRLVAELNTARDEQGARLVALDALRGSVNDAGLGSFLDKAIRPRRTRVGEVVPQRLSEWVSITTAK